MIRNVLPISKFGSIDSFIELRFSPYHRPQINSPRHVTHVRRSSCNAAECGTELRLHHWLRSAMRVSKRGHEKAQQMLKPDLSKESKSFSSERQAIDRDEAVSVLPFFGVSAAPLKYGA